MTLKEEESESDEEISSGLIISDATEFVRKISTTSAATTSHETSSASAATIKVKVEKGDENLADSAVYSELNVKKEEDENTMAMDMDIKEEDENLPSDQDNDVIKK